MLTIDSALDAIIERGWKVFRRHECSSGPHIIAFHPDHGLRFLFLATDDRGITEEESRLFRDAESFSFLICEPSDIARACNTLPPEPGEQSVPERLISYLQGKGKHDFARKIAIRSAYGQVKYGTTLETFNGRDAVQDALEEIRDLAQYVMQTALEGGDLDAIRGELSIVVGMLSELEGVRGDRSRSSQLRRHPLGPSSQGRREVQGEDVPRV